MSLQTTLEAEEHLAEQLSLEQTPNIENSLINRAGTHTAADSKREWQN
jgi:hypothetical protein